MTFTREIESCTDVSTRTRNTMGVPEIFRQENIFFYVDYSFLYEKYCIESLIPPWV